MTASIAALMGGAASSPPSPLAVDVHFNNYDTSFFVSGVTGELIAFFGPPGILQFVVTGGTPPYTPTVSTLNILGVTDPSDSIAFFVHSPYTTISWNLPNVGDTVAFTISHTEVDSGTPQQTASTTAPPSGVFIIKRTA